MTQLHTNFTLSGVDVSKVSKTRFGIISPKKIADMAVCEVTKTECLENDIPVENGLMDQRMGTCDRRIDCASCDGNFKECSGHFGYIKLAGAIFHPSFFEYCYKILRCVCFNCGKLKADQSNIRFQEVLKIRDSRKRFKGIYEICQNITKCYKTKQSALSVSKKVEADAIFKGYMDGLYRNHGGCGISQPTFRKEGGLRISVKTQGEHGAVVENLSAIVVNQILQKISKVDCELMGFSYDYSRPNWMILQNLPVPPPQVRPSIKYGASLRGEDDITNKYREIIRVNEKLKKLRDEGKSGHQLSGYWILLQYHVATLFKSDVSGMPPTKNSYISIMDRLKGKEGRIRQNLMGKRVDFSARTVITPDSNISINEVGIPQSIAMNLTTPELVTPFNISELTDYVENGPDEHPGAKYIITDKGIRYDLNYCDSLKLEIGWIVERHLQDGDVVLFNRQPTLHKMSMMSHHIRILPYSTFRLNLSVTSPYNADFDGDEMNLHVPQSLVTRAELLELMMVSKHILSPQKNQPIIGIVQDSLLGCSKITRRDIFMNKKEMMNCLMLISDWDGKIPIPTIFKPEPLWTGKQILSILIPSEVSMIRKNKIFSSDIEKEDNILTLQDSMVVIEQGELICGIMDKNVLGTSSGSLIHIIDQECGEDVCRGFLDTTQKVVNYWLLHNGFTVGFGDAIADREGMINVQRIIDFAKMEVKNIVSLAQAGNLQAEPGRTLIETFEHQVNLKLNNATKDAGTRAHKSLSEKNNVSAMVSAGSKGNELNISQIIACVGQVNVSGKRVGYGFHRRTLPHFESNDHGPEARGFVENSYLKGLTPQEFFFHAMGGREGIIDTACKTAETGYIQRRLVKCLEDIHIAYDRTVRDSSGNIIQFLYGEDAMDASRLEFQDLPIITESDEVFRKKYKHDFEEVEEGYSLGRDFGVGYMSNVVFRRFSEQLEKGHFEILNQEYDRLVNDRNILRREIFRRVDDPIIVLPVNLSRLIRRGQDVYDIDTTSVSDLDPIEVIYEVQKLIEEIMKVIVNGEDNISEETQINSTLLFVIYLRATFASKRVLSEYRLDKNSLQFVLEQVLRTFGDAIADPGEMVGALSGQCIGEPATQMTLNTFHFAGISSKNVTLGIPRLKELLNATVKVKTPMLSIFLIEDAREDKEVAEKLTTGLVYTTLENLVEKSEIYFDPLGSKFSTQIKRDQELVRNTFLINEELQSLCPRLSPWLLRFTLSRVGMSDIDMDVVKEKIEEGFGGNLLVIAEDSYGDELVIRMRIINIEGDDDSDSDIAILKQLERIMLKKIVIRGIPDITKVYLRQVNFLHYTSSGRQTKKEWLLETDGVNLRDVLGCDHVDWKRTTSNSVVEILNCFGIEAARKALLSELRSVFEVYGTYVNFRHFALLIDSMCHTGEILPISRHGVQKSDAGFLMKASFEECSKVLCQASVFADVEHIRGVSACCMHGQLAKVGTGYFDIFADEKMLKTGTFFRNVKEDGENFLSSAVYAPSPYVIGGAVTPYGSYGSYAGPSTPDLSSSFSPFPADEGSFSPAFSGGVQEEDLDKDNPFSNLPSNHHHQPYSATIQYNTSRDQYSPTASQQSPASPIYPPQYSPTAPQYSPTSPTFDIVRNDGKKKE